MTLDDLTLQLQRLRKETGGDTEVVTGEEFQDSSRRKNVGGAEIAHFDNMTGRLEFADWDDHKRHKERFERVVVIERES